MVEFPAKPVEIPELDGVEVEGKEPEKDTEETEDGGLLIKDKEPKKDTEEFYVNLASRLDPNERKKIALELVDLIGKDKESRKKRDEQYADGIKRTGLGNETPGGANFPGASRAVHPVLAEACVDFAASTMRELLPPNGPVKTKVIGTQSIEKYKKAQRKSQHMNWQLTEEMPEFSPEMEQMLTQLGLGGSQYIKLYRNARLKRAQAEFVPIDDIYLPFAATYFYTAERITHRQLITEMEFTQRVEDGVYIDIDASPPSQLPQPSAASEATDTVEGKEKSDPYNVDGQREIFETSLYRDWPKGVDDLAEDYAPYIVILDESRTDIFGIYRNWEETDERQARMDWIVEFCFIPWRGATGVGFPHLIGGLSIAATGILRALLDSALANTVPGGMRLSSLVPGQTQNPQVGQYTSIQGPPSVDDIRKLFMPTVVNQPSPVLLELLGIVVNGAKGLVSTAEEKISEAGNDMPVGTALALIEQGAKVFSSIHARLHRSMKMVLKVLHRLNRMYLDEEQVIEELGELVVCAEDYEGPMDVIPVSDPNIFSETQRYAQMQAVTSRADAKPQLYKQAAVEQRLLEVLKVPQPDELLVETFEPEETDAVHENTSLALTRPVEAYPEQDHVAHLMVHLAFLADPNFGANPLIASTIVLPAINHLKEHIAYFYQQQMFKTALRASSVDIQDLEDNQTEEVKKSVDKILAATAAVFHDASKFQVPNVIPAIPQAVMQLIQSAQAAMQVIGPLMKQSQPQDPAAAAMAAETARKEKETQALLPLKTQEAQAKVTTANAKATEAQGKAAITQVEAQGKAAEGQGKTMDTQLRAQLEARKLALAEQAQQLDERRVALEEERLGLERQQAELDDQLKRDISDDQLAVKVQTNTEDNLTAKELTEMEIAAGNKTNLKNGTGINP